MPDEYKMSAIRSLVPEGGKIDQALTLQQNSIKTYSEVRGLIMEMAGNMMAKKRDAHDDDPFLGGLDDEEDLKKGWRGEARLLR